MAASVAAGIEAAGSSGGSGGILGIGIAGNAIGIGSLTQPSTSNTATPTEPDSTLNKLQELKVAVDKGLITQAEFEAAKANILGIKPRE
jgi:hypothetical protein